MIIKRKHLSLLKINTIFSRQKVFLGYHFNQTSIRYFKTLSNNNIVHLKMATHFDVNRSHNSNLSKSNDLNGQRYSSVDKIPYSSGLDQLEANESYRFNGSNYFKGALLNKDSDPNLETGWVKEAMLVEHEAYHKLLTTYLPNVSAVVSFYMHKLTGLTLVSFKTNDSNSEMCFDVSAPTYQFNDHGCTHIVEHSVLIRTEGYNVFNAFYAQVAGTYHSFLNALFYKNRTRYYFASLNERAFYQLADQFMASFFRPSFLRSPDILNQEGWHYKVVKSDDKRLNSREFGVDLHGRHVTFSGIVYNEMKKRSYATPLDRAVSILDHNLFTNSFMYDSGGNPEDIVDLTQTELSDFYKLYYGPQTATVYFHGPEDVYKRLKFVDDYLKRYNLGLKPDPQTGEYSHTATPDFVRNLSLYEEYKDNPKYVKSEYNALHKDEDVLMMGWLLDPKFKGTNKYELDSVDKLAFEVLKHLLLDSTNSLLESALVDSKLGARVVGPGLDDFYPLYPHMTFMFGVDGVKYTDKTREENLLKFEQLVFKTLKYVVTNGFKRDSVEAALSRVEFKHTEQHYTMKEHRQGYYPKGLTLLRYFQPQLEQGKDPLEFMRLDKLLVELRTRVTLDPKYLPNLVKKHMLNNTTRVTLHLQAVESEQYEKAFHKKVTEKLQSRLSKLSREEVDKMEQEYNEYKLEREQPLAQTTYDAFPDFDPKEVVKRTSNDKKYVYRLSENSFKEYNSLKRSNSDETQVEVTVLANSVDSNGVLYMEYAVSLDSLSVEELKYMNLFSMMVQEAGTEDMSSEEVSYYVDKNLGGLSFSTYFSTVSNNQTYDDPNKGVGYLVVRSKSLKHKTDKMVDVVHDLLSNANFSNYEKGVMLLRRSVNYLESALRDNAHVYTLRRMASRFSVANYADELANGYSQLVYMREQLLPLAEKDWSKVESRLNDMRTKLLNLRNVTVNLTGDQELVENFLKQPSAFYNKLSSTFKYNSNNEHTNVWVSEVLKNKLMESSNQNELMVMPVRNNFVGVGGKLFDVNDKYSGEHAVAMHYLMRSYLYRYLRSLGGAYGVHVYLMNTGHVAFVSYADPNFLETLDVYKSVSQSMKEAYETLSDKGMRMHVVGMLANMDKQHHPEDKAMSVLTSYLRGESKEFSERYRQEVASTTKDVFRQVEKRFNETKDSYKVCSLVNRVSAETAPSDYKRLY